MKPGTPDFGRLAADYDRVRPTDDSWRNIFQLVVTEADLRGRSVLDCGCGTGRLAKALAEECGASVTGVDAEPAMLAVGRSNSPGTVDLREGRAEDLPFPDALFERAVLWLVCHLVDRPVSFRELGRVLAENGRLVVVTFDPAHFDGFWLNTYFPSLEGVDRARFPTRDRLETELADAGFGTLRFLRRSQWVSVSREDALERIRARHISTFDLLDPYEVRTGTERAMEELPTVVEYAIEWLIAIAEH